MSEFKKWFVDQDFYTNMRFIHGDGLFAKDGEVYRVLPVQMTYQAWQTARYKTKDERIALTQEWHTKGWNARQSEIDQLKAENEKLELELSQTKQVLHNVIDIERSNVEKLKAEKAGLEKRVEAALNFANFSSEISIGAFVELNKTLRGGHE